MTALTGWQLGCQAAPQAPKVWCFATTSLVLRLNGDENKQGFLCGWQLGCQQRRALK